MRLTERDLRAQIRQVMLESYAESLGVDDSDYARIESVWSKAVDIMESLEAALINKHSAEIEQEVPQAISSVAESRGIPEEDVLDNDVAFDSVEYSVVKFAAQILEEDRGFAQELKRLENILKLTVILFLKKSKDISSEDQNRIADVAQAGVSRLVRKRIARLAAAVALNSVTGIDLMGLVGENQTVRQNADSALYGVLTIASDAAKYIDALP